MARPFRPFMPAAIALLIGLSACGTNGVSPVSEVRVRGTVTAGPTCPVERDPPDPGCAARPVAGAVLVFIDTDGTEVGRATSAADGTFMIELAPGAYHLVAEPVEGLMGTPEPIDLTVAPGQPLAELQLTYDTGIR